MAGVNADRLRDEGYERKRRLDAALPMPVWRLDLEIERQREISASESTVLRLVDAGAGEPASLTELMGLRDDRRLTEQVLVRLLGAQAVEPKGSGFVLTEAGRLWLRNGAVTGRERVSFEIRLDPVRDAFEWVDSERPAFASVETWTIDMHRVDDGSISTRKAEIGRLVRDQGLPDDDDEAPRQRVARLDLRSFAVTDRRVHWRPVRIDVWQHPNRTDDRLIAYLGDAESPALTEALASFVLEESPRRVRLR